MNPCSHLTSLRLSQMSRMGSMAMNDGVHTYILYLTAKDQRKTLTETLSVNKAQFVILN